MMPVVNRDAPLRLAYIIMQLQQAFKINVEFRVM